MALLFVIRTMFFNANTTELTKAAKAYNVTLQDQPHSFNIVPSENRQDTGLIFYPGASVDSRAYASKLAGIANTKDIKVFIVKPYLRLADLNPNAASSIMNANPRIKKWYVGGHSMGGGMACSFSNRHPSSVAGLFLLAAYCSPNDKQFSGPTLALVGTNDKLEPYAKVQSRLPSKTTIIQINGANHSSFGNYGSQPFDGEQTINEFDMTSAITKALANFIK